MSLRALVLFTLAAVAGRAATTELAPVAPAAGAEPAPAKISPTLADVAYGEHPRQVLDFWQAPAAASDSPTPLVFHIHGGGWVKGDKGLRNPARFLEAGISVVSISYRYTTQAQQAGVQPPVEWPMNDARRALQFVRAKAAEWNIDPARIGAWGGSAGACSGLWLALRDDMADPASPDPVARQSTRLFCAAVDGAQTTLDPLLMREWTPNSRYGGHAFGLMDATDIQTRDLNFADFLARRDELLPWIRQYSPLEHASPDDPPIYLGYDNRPALGQPAKDPTHSANFGVKLKERLDALRVPCELVYPDSPDVVHADSAAYLVAKLSKAAASARISIAEAGAVADAATVNTAVIQSVIDTLASTGGGTVGVPAGVFVSGALDFKPGVHLHLEKDAVLRASADVAKHFPARPTRIEGQRKEFTPALINADHCDGFRLTGEGTLDGDGRKIWDEFWRLRKAAPDPKNFPNQSVPRARLAFISNSRDVRIEGVTFKDSQFWNLHLYLCRDIVVSRARFVVPDDYKQAPSTDAIDIDSSQDVLVDGCYFSITDDAVAMKGTKGPRALEDASSPPVERVTIRDCEFRRAHAALTCGSEATIVRDVVLENSRVTGSMSVLTLKLRTDTPQTYERITMRDLVLDASGGTLVSVAPWTQYADLQGLPPPRSVVRDVIIEGVTGRYGTFGSIAGNPGRTTLDGFAFKNIDLRLGKDRLAAGDVKNLRFENVVINGVSR